MRFMTNRLYKLIGFTSWIIILSLFFYTAKYGNEEHRGLSFSLCIAILISLVVFEIVVKDVKGITSFIGICIMVIFLVLTMTVLINEIFVYLFI